MGPPVSAKSDSGLRVMGVDPGLTRTGLGVVDHSDGRLVAVTSATITTPADAPSGDRLARLLDALSGAMCRWQPHEVAVERVFFKLNAQTAVPAIQAAGIALLAAARFGDRKSVV